MRIFNTDFFFLRLSLFSTVLDIPWTVSTCSARNILRCMAFFATSTRSQKGGTWGVRESEKFTDAHMFVLKVPDKPLWPCLHLKHMCPSNLCCHVYKHVSIRSEHLRAQCPTDTICQLSPPIQHALVVTGSHLVSYPQNGSAEYTVHRVHTRHCPPYSTPPNICETGARCVA